MFVFSAGESDVRFDTLADFRLDALTTVSTTAVTHRYSDINNNNTSSISSNNNVRG